VKLFAGCFGALLLCACASTPSEPLALSEARQTSELALRATASGDWQVAAQRWQEAARQYSTLDDWADAGRAALGSAQALVCAKGDAAARAILTGLAAAMRYPAEVRAEAHYQLALIDIEVGDLAAASGQLNEASSMLDAKLSLQAAIANAQARIAAKQGNWGEVTARAGQALAVADIEGGERANAKRLLAQAAMQRQDWEPAYAWLTEVLAFDRSLARPASIVADLRLLAQLSRLRGDATAALWAERADAACQALGPAQCPQAALPQ
jgi:tetratricopeptide (TPR) repeat protein